MEARGTGRGARLGRTILPLVAVLAIGLLLLTGLPIGGSGATRGAAPGSTHAAVVMPASTPVTQIYVNRSQTSGTYVNEYVTLNNSSTLTKIPSGVITVKSATDCRWVTVQNLTTNAIPVSVFHNVQYRNVTSANASGTLTAGTSVTSFKICGGTANWVNFVYWTFGVYNFVTSTLPVNGTAKVAFGAYPGTTATPASLSLAFGTKGAISLKVASNLSFQIVFPTSVNGATTCDFTQQVCSFPQYTFASGSGVVGTSTFANTTGTITYGTVGSSLGFAKVSAQYANWTLGYSTTNISANTAVGGFFAATQGFFQTWFVNFVWVWVILLLLVIAIAAILMSRRRRRGGRR